MYIIHNIHIFFSVHAYHVTNICTYICIYIHSFFFLDSVKISLKLPVWWWWLWWCVVCSVVVKGGLVDWVVESVLIVLTGARTVVVVAVVVVVVVFAVVSVPGTPRLQLFCSQHCWERLLIWLLFRPISHTFK